MAASLDKTTNDSQNSISLNKFISQTGICSRRDADQLIEDGRVLLNGKRAKKGNRVFDGDQVLLDNQLIKGKPKQIYIAFHKPPGITSTTDLKDKDNMIDFINFPERIFPIGRLDKASTGLILLTNDGNIVNKILRVEHNHEKEYIVTVDKPINEEFIMKMENGLPILGKKTKKCKVEKLGNRRFRIILTQGLNRQIRRMCEYLNYKVITLKRVRVMNIHLHNLAKGKWRYLNAEELKILKAQL